MCSSFLKATKAHIPTTKITPTTPTAMYTYIIELLVEEELFPPLSGITVSFSLTEATALASSASLCGVSATTVSVSGSSFPSLPAFRLGSVEPSEV